MRLNTKHEICIQCMTEKRITVEPLLSGHPREMGGGRFIGVGLCWLFSTSGFLVNMESLKFKTIMINLCFNAFNTLHFLFRTLICCRLFPSKAVNLRILNFGWPLNRGKDDRKNLISDISELVSQQIKCCKFAESCAYYWSVKCRQKMSEEIASCSLFGPFAQWRRGLEKEI